MAYLTMAEKGGVTVLGFGGLQRIDNDNFEDIEKELVDCVGEMKEKIILNFDGIKHLRSFALNMVINFYQLVRDRKQEIRFCEMSATVRDIFEVAGLAGIFQIDAAEADSLKAFGANQP